MAALARRVLALAEAGELDCIVVLAIGQEGRDDKYISACAGEIPYLKVMGLLEDMKIKLYHEPFKEKKDVDVDLE